MEGVDIEALVIDVIGLRCPIPVQRTRKALRTLPPGGVIHLIGDDPESMHDIPALIERLGLTEVEVMERGSNWLYVIKNLPVNG